MCAELSQSLNTTLSIDSLHKRYGSHNVLNGLSLQIEPNSIVGLVGLNGSGKTTTIECLLGLQRFQDGTISVLGTSPKDIFQLKGRVAAVFDQPCLYPGLSVRQSSMHTRFVLRNHSSEPVTLEDSFRLTRYRKFKTKKLSFGNKRRTAIMQALIGPPDFVVFDEPFIGLDAEGVEDVLHIIKNENKDRGTTFLLASHQLPYLERICTHIAILHEGSIALHDKIENLLASNSLSVRVRSPQCAEIAELVLAHQKIDLVRHLGDDTVELSLEDLTSAELNRLLVQGGISVSELEVVRQSLNSLFRSITNQDFDQEVGQPQ